MRVTVYYKDGFRPPSKMDDDKETVWETFSNVIGVSVVNGFFDVEMTEGNFARINCESVCKIEGYSDEH